jgi:hypothetical protein
MMHGAQIVRHWLLFRVQHPAALDPACQSEHARGERQCMQQVAKRDPDAKTLIDLDIHRSQKSISPLQP